jgi:hypothetical protein
MADISTAATIQAEVPRQSVNLSPEQSVAPTTTSQQDLVTAGQRKINLIWEWTQSVISVSVVASNMIVAVYDGISSQPHEFPTVLSSALFLIVGFYFSRTNHAAIGGIGNKPAGMYVGR